MKTILLNAGPRKNANTAQLLRAAETGAAEAGAQTTYIDLYDLNFTGCRSCLACKRVGAKRCKCYWPDDLSPLLDQIFEADALLVGSPIYLGTTTSQFHALLERLEFTTLSYDDYRNYFTGQVNVGLIFTMNADQAYYDAQIAPRLAPQIEAFRRLNGALEVLPGCDTLQVKDYSRYSMASFDAAHKQAVHRDQFPKDLARARKLGARLSVR